MTSWFDHHWFQLVKCFLHNTCLLRCSLTVWRSIKSAVLQRKEKSDYELLSLERYWSRAVSEHWPFLYENEDKPSSDFYWWTKWQPQLVDKLCREAQAGLRQMVGVNRWLSTMCAAFRKTHWTQWHRKDPEASVVPVRHIQTLSLTHTHKS